MCTFSSFVMSGRLRLLIGRRAVTITAERSFVSGGGDETDSVSLFTSEIDFKAAPLNIFHWFVCVCACVRV